MAERSADSGPNTAARSIDEPTVYEHLRATDETARKVDSVDPAIYRVVGTSAGTAALLRVSDADGRRINTGQVVTVNREALAAFEPAENPDGNRSVGARASGFVDSLAWQLRTFGRGLAARPIPALAGIALLILGAWGDRYVDAPGIAFTLAYLLGVLVVIYVGSRGG